MDLRVLRRETFISTNKSKQLETKTFVHLSAPRIATSNAVLEAPSGNGELPVTATTLKSAVGSIGAHEA
jgi:hypothetical protein